MQSDTKRPLVHKVVLDNILNTIGRLPPETGGVLGADKNGVICSYHYDMSGAASLGTYTPAAGDLNRKLFPAWDRAGIRLSGFVHSHPGISPAHPSQADLNYAGKFFQSVDYLTRFQMPILSRVADRQSPHLAWWLAVPNARREVGHIEQVEPIVVDGVANANKSEAEDSTGGFPVIRSVLDDSLLLNDHSFDRVKSSIDLPTVGLTRVFGIGAGGGFGMYEDLARAGFRDFVLVDFDRISVENIATQHVSRKSIGRPKVEFLAQRIKDINPEANVRCIVKRIQEISDGEFHSMAFGPTRRAEALPSTILVGGRWLPVRADVQLRPVNTILCGLTDDFYAQMRCSKLAVHFGLPCMLSQVYQNGAAIEVVFYYPAVTCACPRCILHTRYQKFLAGYKNDVTSSGTTIQATTRANAIRGTVVMALAHHGSGHPRWSQVLERIKDSQLIQVRLDPDFPLPAFDKAFNGISHGMFKFDEAVFVPVRPRNGCEDCGGTGQAVGKFRDTRMIG